MGIVFERENQIFHLQTPNTSYIMAIVNGKFLAHVYWGKRIHTPKLQNALLNRSIGYSPLTEKGDNPVYLDFLCQEYPTGCGTDYRIPALSGVNPDGSRTIELTYEDYRIISGKQALKGLPATYVKEQEEADTLEVVLRDRLTNLKITLSYSVFRNLDAITRNVRVENESSETIILEKVLSASVDFERGDFDMIVFPGAWGRERRMERLAIHSGIQAIESRRGASSHQMNPFFVLADKEAKEEYGEVYGFNLVYSGNFTGGVEVDQLHKSRVWMGINDYDFSWRLEQGEEFQTPEVVMVYSAQGFGAMSRTFHNLYRNHLVRGKFKDAPRPILVNNWEATYFDFTEEKILRLANEAADLGIELFVLDDGWFGKRNSDTCSLGDWYVNKEKLPEGIKGLAEKVNKLGIQFGLWMEPEMISPNSDLYRAHPDWCIHVPNRNRSECRNQLTLDLSRKEVCDYIIETVSGILDSANISYVKWDMNRHMSHLGSAGLPAERQKEMPHRYMLGLYYVLEKIISSHPNVLFESCSGGGGRFDPGMLYYTPQVWTSDDTDAVERLFIQYGTSLAYPISTMGAHVSAVPNHQANRVTSLKTRGDVAMSGNFGYELDLTMLSSEEKEEIKQQIKQYKELREFLPYAEMYRLKSPYEGNETAWMFISQDKKDIFVAYFSILCEINPGIRRLKFVALEPDTEYEILGENISYSGDELMEIGLVVECWGDFQSKTWRLRKKEL